jgi:hypothetical protein
MVLLARLSKRPCNELLESVQQVKAVLVGVAGRRQRLQLAEQLDQRLECGAAVTS